MITCKVCFFVNPLVSLKPGTSVVNILHILVVAVVDVNADNLRCIIDA